MKINYKMLYLVVVGIVLTLSVAGFLFLIQGEEPAEKPVEVLWTITIEGVEGVEEFTNIDADKLEMVEIDVVHRRRDVETPQTWTGIRLRDVMAHLEVADFRTITIVAGDGFTAEYTPDIVNADDSILGFLLDGKELDEESWPARTVIGTRGARYWVKNVTKIIVNQ